MRYFKPRNCHKMSSWKGPFLSPSIGAGQIYSSLSCGPLTGSHIKKSSSPTLLPRVVENVELVSPDKSRIPRLISHDGSTPAEVQSNLQRKLKGEDWNNLQRCVLSLFTEKTGSLQPGELNALHQNIRTLLESKTGTFFYDYFKQELLSKGMISLRDELKMFSGENLLKKTQEIWNTFYTKILPALEAIMFPVKTRSCQAIRLTALTIFRDIVVIHIHLNVALDSTISASTYLGLKQMFLVLQSLNDVYPPTKNKLKMETLAARVIVPFLGFRGLYAGGPDPIVESSEPSMLDRKKSSEIATSRRVSRPFSVQPKQLEHLNDLFLMAIRKQQVSNFVR